MPAQSETDNLYGEAISKCKRVVLRRKGHTRGFVFDLDAEQGAERHDLRDMVHV